MVWWEQSWTFLAVIAVDMFGYTAHHQKNTTIPIPSKNAIKGNDKQVKMCHTN